MWDFHRELKSGKLQCTACPRLCQLSDNEVGWCGARIRKGMKIEPRTYGLIHGRLAEDPIEKKPLYHYHPGKKILSFGSYGCNLGCLHCQNWHISMQKEKSDISKLIKKSPEEIVDDCIDRKMKLIASTYNEPMIAFEYVRDIATLAHKHNIKMVVVDNGYITRKLAEALTPYIDAANIDIKGFSSEFYKEICDSPSWKPILKTCEIFHNQGVHLELTNLIIPTKNDSDSMIREMCEWIYEKLSPLIPLHFSAFRPDYKLNHLPYTSIKTLEKAIRTATDVGLKYVYIGNVSGHKGNHTYCHNCGKLVIKRERFFTGIVNLHGNCCSSCGTQLPIIVASE
ncbi:MAG: AmmeMemoRadiSam system radical SAM enzyme [Candidatus Hodarchaeales archaeon]